MHFIHSKMEDRNHPSLAAASTVALRLDPQELECCFAELKAAQALSAFQPMLLNAFTAH